MTGAVYEYNIMSVTNTFKTMDYEKQLKERVILNEVYAKQAQLQQAQVSLAPRPPCVCGCYLMYRYHWYSMFLF